MSYNLNLVAWNCPGGLSFARKNRFIRSLVSNNNLSLLGLIETKKEAFDDFGIRSLWLHLDFDYSFAPSAGSSGGLLCIWNPKFIVPYRIAKANRWISLDFIWSSVHVIFILICASNFPRERASLWYDILHELNSDFLCILVGDFNEILDPSGSFNCTSFSASMLAFSDFISASNLVESNLQGRFFTWQNSISKSKIDRCFLSPAAFSFWPNNVLKALPSYSDNVPLLFCSDVASNWGPKPFKSINAWWSRKDFFSFVESSWSNISLKMPNANLVFRLRELRNLVKIWNRDIFGNLNSKFDAVQAEITALESLADFGSLSELDGSRLSTLKSESNQLSIHIKSLWHQKLRLNWNFHGETNSKYFHTVASLHSKNNIISEVIIDGVSFKSPLDIKQRTHAFYKALYKKNSQVSFTLDSLPIESLTDLQAASLLMPFAEEEIVTTLMSCDEKKAPAPDGFNYFFYKKSWKIFRQDFLKLFKEFFHSASFPIGINTAFLVLIPKFQGASDIKDFRPISLINGVFKLLSKVLTNRLSPVLLLFQRTNSVSLREEVSTIAT
ncbi:uncharacterized protein LOC130014830 [Mercurialis annua]|uniref:uncharacterized protein LOC130014830 n=1 Tax=Mercurialis annua TaxID=3986 RepID=UPI0024AE3A65|nr:uncharacterized protein LOC130014830 [Mercurialis annua]